MTDRTEFEAWIKTTEGHPFAGKFADLMWFAWQAAIKQEREAILAAIDDTEEPAWYGYENPHGFDDGKRAALDVVRARSPSTPVQGEP